MKDITIKYIRIEDKLLEQNTILRYKILFEPYHKINKYTYDSLDSISYHLATFYENKIVGYSRLTNIDGKGKITNVFVISEYRKRNIGHKMLIKHIEKAKQEKFSQLYLNARISTVNFYKKVGFVKEGTSYISDKSGLMLQNMVMYL
ncbi:MAG TPA: GNAT family N-acetyltransferase [Clostridium sp.]|nr:GNAT family N-acetyltransferase [Clostridium sp.]